MMKFNEVRYRALSTVLLWLYSVRHNQGKEDVFTAGQLARETGQSYTYVRSKASKWVEWDFVTRAPVVAGDHRPCWGYALGAKGKTFIEKQLPPEWRDHYLAQLTEYRQTLKAPQAKAAE